MFQFVFKQVPWLGLNNADSNENTIFFNFFEMNTSEQHKEMQGSCLLTKLNIANFVMQDYIVLSFTHILWVFFAVHTLTGMWFCLNH